MRFAAPVCIGICLLVAWYNLQHAGPPPVPFPDKAVRMIIDLELTGPEKSQELRLWRWLGPLGERYRSYMPEQNIEWGTTGTTIWVSGYFRLAGLPVRKHIHGLMQPFYCFESSRASRFGLFGTWAGGQAVVDEFTDTVHSWQADVPAGHVSYTSRYIWDYAVRNQSFKPRVNTTGMIHIDLDRLDGPPAIPLYGLPEDASWGRGRQDPPLSTWILKNSGATIVILRLDGKRPAPFHWACTYDILNAFPVRLVRAGQWNMFSVSLEKAQFFFISDLDVQSLYELVVSMQFNQKDSEI